MFRLAVPLLSGLLAFMPVVDNEPITTEPTLYSLNYTIKHTSYVPDYRVIGEKQDIIDEQIIDDLISEFEYNFDRRFTVYLVDRESAESLYGVAFDNYKIYLFPKEEDDVISALYHELGHLVYYDLTTKERNEWKKFKELPSDWNEHSEYLYRPSEIFANDFDIMFNTCRSKEDLENMYYYYYPITLSSKKIETLRKFVISFGE